MLDLSYQHFELPFEFPFVLSKGRRETQPTLILRLTSPTGKEGYGEVTAIPYYQQDLESMIERLARYEKGICQHALIDPQRFHHYLHHLMGDDPFLISALDMAAWDLFAKVQRRPLYQLFRLPHRHGVQTDYTLGIDAIDRLLEKIRTHPWPIYKLKIGQADDITLIEALRRETDAPFRVDANESLEADDALRLLPELRKLGVTLLEQPLPREAWEDMAHLKSHNIIPLIADESLQTAEDLDRCMESFDGINIKLSKLGGISPCLHLIAAARKKNARIMIGSFCESSIGTAAAVPFLGLADFADLDGPLLLGQDLGTGLSYETGQPILDPQAPGLGIQLDPEKFGDWLRL